MQSSRLQQRKSAFRIRTLAGFCGGAAILLFVFSQVLVLKPLRLAELSFQDRMLALGRKAPVNPDLVFVAIDEASLRLDQLDDAQIAATPALALMKQGFPWSREVHSLVLDRLVAAGARVVLFDLLFDSPRDGDDAFRLALERHAGRVVVGCNFAESDPGQADTGLTLLTLPADSILDWPEAGDPRLGFVNFWPDADGVIRSVRYHMTLSETQGRNPTGDEPSYASLAAAALRLDGRPALAPADSSPRRFRFADPAAEAYRGIPIYTLFDPAMWRQNLNDGAVFKDKIVLVGPSASRFHDVQNTPLGSLLGPQLHLQAIAAALNSDYYTVSPPVFELVNIVIGATLAWSIVSFFRRPLLCLCLLLACAAIYVAGAILLFNLANYLVTGIAPLATLLAGGAFSITYDYAQERLEKARVRGTLERYVSRNVVREILDNQEAYLESLGGSRKAVTILFSDVRGFTSISERTDPAELVHQLNEYLGAMVDVVFQHYGTVDKFVGDAVMAVWGNVSSEGAAKDAERAVRAALDMRRALAALNDRWAAAGRTPFSIGIGLNHGDAIFGNIGSEQKMEPTVIGDAVNLASRIEGLSKTYKSDIVISQSVADLVRDRFWLRTASLVRVVGKAQPVDTFLVLGARDDESFTPPDWLDDYESGIIHFRRKLFLEAHPRFERSAALAADDHLAAFYLARTELFVVAPPPLEWDGTEIMDHK